MPIYHFLYKETFWSLFQNTGILQQIAKHFSLSGTRCVIWHICGIV